MKATVTAKGQVTIPKELRKKLGFVPGTQIDFEATPDGLRLHRVLDRKKPLEVLGCLKEELSGRSLESLLEELRGPIVFPATANE